MLEHAHSTGILPGSTTGIDDVRAAAGASAAAGAEDDIDRAALERSAQRIRDLLAKLPDFEKLKGQIEIQATPDGMRIELIDSREGTFFDNASAVLKPPTERILAVIGRELSTLGRPVAIEGHTDSRPYNNSDGYTNWELSADRANAARRQMERTGLKPALIKAVRGLADRQLANPADPLDARNRRVSILVVAHSRRGRGSRHAGALRYTASRPPVIHSVPHGPGLDRRPLVEDDTDYARVVSQTVATAAAAWVVVHVAALAPALERLAHGRFDAVLLDLGLPDSGGLDTLAAIAAGRRRRCRSSS